MKLQIAVSRASLIFQKKIQMLLTLKEGSRRKKKKKNDLLRLKQYSFSSLQHNLNMSEFIRINVYMQKHRYA